MSGPQPRSQSLCLATGLGAGVANVVYTSPADKTTLVKEWRLLHEGAGAANLFLILQRGSAFAAVAAYQGVGYGAVQVERQASLVMEPGDQLVVFTDSTGDTKAVISGMQLLGT